MSSMSQGVSGSQVDSAVVGLGAAGATAEEQQSYRDLLNKLQSMGEVAANLSMTGGDFSYLEQALQIKSDFFFGSEKRDKEGRGLSEVLLALANDSDVACSVDGTKRYNAAMLQELMIELANPHTTTQDRHGTCAAEAMSTIVFKDNPAEWTRLVVDLIREGRSETRGGAPLALPDDIDRSDRSKSRSPVARLFQSAVMASFPPNDLSYSNRRDCYVDSAGQDATDPDGKNIEGMSEKQARPALENLLGEPHRLVGQCDDKLLMSEALKSGLYAVLKWDDGAHAVVVTEVKEVLELGALETRVFFRNPHGGAGDHRDGDDIIDGGLVRRSERSEQGIQSMPIKKFQKAVLYSFPRESVYARKGDEPQDVAVDPLKQPGLSQGGLGRESYVRDWRRTAVLLAGLSGLAGVGLAVESWREGADVAWMLDSGHSASPPLDYGAAQRLLAENFLGKDEWQRLLGTEVPMPTEFPTGITEGLMKKRCKVQDNGDLVSETHRLMIVPNMGLKELKSVCDHAGVSLGLASDGAIPPLGEVNGGSEWSMVPNLQEQGGDFDRQFRGRIFEAQDSRLTENYPGYRLSSAREVVLAIASAQASGQDVPSGTYRCKGQMGGREVCVDWDANSKTITLGNHYYFEFYGKRVGVAVAYNLDRSD